MFNKPTRRTRASRTRIDHVIRENIQCNAIALEQRSFSDHEALLVTSNLKGKASNQTYYRGYSFLENTQVFGRYLQILTNELSGTQNCNENIDDINMAFDCFQEKFLKVTHSFAPIKNPIKKLRNYLSGSTTG